MSKKMKITTVLIVLFLSMLILNVMLHKNIQAQSKKTVKKAIVKNVKKSDNTDHCYGNIIGSILDCAELEMKNINIMQNNSCEIELVYNGKANDLYKCIYNIKFDKNLYVVKNIKYMKLEKDIFTINMVFNYISEGK